MRWAQIVTVGVGLLVGAAVGVVLVVKLLWLLTALVHATKPEEMKEANDVEWDRDQGHEVE